MGSTLLSCGAWRVCFVGDILTLSLLQPDLCLPGDPISDEVKEALLCPRATFLFPSTQGLYPPQDLVTAFMDKHSANMGVMHVNRVPKPDFTPPHAGVFNTFLQHAQSLAGASKRWHWGGIVPFSVVAGASSFFPPRVDTCYIDVFGPFDGKHPIVSPRCSPSDIAVETCNYSTPDIRILLVVPTCYSYSQVSNLMRSIDNAAVCVVALTSQVNSIACLRNFRRASSLVCDNQDWTIMGENPDGPSFVHLELPTNYSFTVPPPSLLKAYRWLSLARYTPDRYAWSAAQASVAGRTMRYRGPRVLPTQVTPNYHMDEEDLAFVEHKVCEAMLAGLLVLVALLPFANCIVSPRFVRTTPEGKKRVIVDYTRPGINSHIDADRAFSISSVQAGAELAHAAGPGAILLKADIRSAYNFNTTAACDLPFACERDSPPKQGSYVKLTAQWGNSSAGFCLFDVAHVFATICQLMLLVALIFYVDDYLLVIPGRNGQIDWPRVHWVARSLCQLGNFLNLPLGKFDAGWRIVFLGVTLDTRLNRMFIPSERMARSAARLAAVISSGSAPMRARHLASLLGDIAWSACIVKLLKIRIYAVWTSLAHRVASAGWNCEFRLSAIDLSALRHVLIVVEICARNPERFSRPLKFCLGYDTPTAWSDASKTGVGVVISHVGFWQGQWRHPASLVGKKGALLMPLMEAYGLAAAVDLCIEVGAVADGGLVVGIDSKSVLGAVLKGRSSSPAIHDVLSSVFSTVAERNIDLFVAYVNTDCNHADAPSRIFPLSHIQISGQKRLHVIRCSRLLPAIFRSS